VMARTVDRISILFDQHTKGGAATTGQ